MNKNKFISSVMCTSMLLSSVLPVFATQTLTNETLSQREETEVLYSKSATYIVTIPKQITLGEDKTSTYSVKVDGDIPSDKEVYVSPIDVISETDTIDFYMEDQSKVNKKDPVKATVTPTKKVWNFKEVANATEVTDNNIKATDLTSGTWKGTFNFEINMKQVPSITVNATDSNNNDLNASATNIEGEEKEQLLSSLVDTGYITDTSEVDGLINVESDEFDSIASTTFDVSNLYEDGDKVAILHYNEETSEWEYICTDTVENGQVTGDFTSYSPVAFVKVNEDGSFEQIGLRAGLYNANGVMLASWEDSGINVEMDYNLLSHETNPYQTTTTSAYYVLTNTYPETTQVVLPNSVTKLGTYAFSECENLTIVTLPETITSIGNSAFNRCLNLTNVNIPNSVTEIGSYAFNYCEKLNNIVIPNGITVINDYTFNNCKSLTNIELPNTLTEIKTRAFMDCTSLTNINIPSNVKTIDSEVFYGCVNLNKIELPTNITTIGSSAFENTNLTSFILPASVTSCGSGILRNCENVTSIVVESGNTVYDSRNNCNAIIETSTNKLIQGCNNTVIPNDVVSLESFSFSGHTNLTKITIPSSVTNISSYAFSNCDNLNSVTFEDTTTWSTYDWWEDYEVTFDSSELANPTTAASYFKYEYYSDWTKQ